MLRLHLEPTGRWSEAPEEQLKAHRRRLEDACGTAMRQLLLVRGAQHSTRPRMCVAYVCALCFHVYVLTLWSRRE
jgi:hypothetical protein